jgi:hypothetical protein
LRLAATKHNGPQLLKGALLRHIHARIAVRDRFQVGGFGAAAGLAETLNLTLET